jgi:hemolysin activation/secretion protein
MAVALPPPLAPQLGNVEELRSRSGGAMLLAYQQYRLHVFGTDAIPQAKLQAAVQAADSVSNAVRALAGLYYNAGYPAATIIYALSGEDLYLFVALGVVTTTAGPDHLTRYFTGMDASQPLTDLMLEPRRTLASLQADRAGQNVTPEFLLQSNGTYQLDLKTEPGKGGQTAFKFEVNNPGNRFVGRHFADLDAKFNDQWGDEFHLLGRRSLDFLNKGNEGNDYVEGDLGWDRVTPYGVFGLSGSNIHYHVTVENIPLPTAPQTKVSLPLVGDLKSAEFDWFGLLTAGFSSRWTLQTRLGRTDKKTDAQALTEVYGEAQQREIYNWAELSTVYSRVFALGEQHLTVETGLGVGKGLSGMRRGPAKDANDQPIDNPTDFAYLLWKPSLKLQLQTTRSITLTFDALAQFTRHTLPEQQQWILGGLNNVTAYLPGVATGDAGLITRLSGEPLPIALGSHFKIVPKLFAEYGYSKLQFEGVEPYSQPGAPQDRPSLADVGLELDLACYDWLETTLTYAQPFFHSEIRESELDASRAYLYFQVAAKF